MKRSRICHGLVEPLVLLQVRDLIYEHNDILYANCLDNDVDRLF